PSSNGGSAPARRRGRLPNLANNPSQEVTWLRNVIRTGKLRTAKTNSTECACLALSMTKTWALATSSSVSRPPLVFGRVVAVNVVRRCSIAGSFSLVGIGRNQNPRGITMENDEAHQQLDNAANSAVIPSQPDAPTTAPPEPMPCPTCANGANTM